MKSPESKLIESFESRYFGLRQYALKERIDKAWAWWDQRIPKRIDECGSDFVLP